jgi:LysR family transcriptional regulator, transcriptional activator of nhaA
MNIYNYNHLFYFYVTAKLNGVTVAAKHLNTSQSSLSSQIKTLEAVIKRKLFKKVGRKIELTDSGKEIYNYCRRSFEIFDEMFDQIENKSTSMGKRISVGVAVDIERPFITDALSKISKQYPKNQRPLLNLVSLPASQLEQLLKLGELDLLLTPNSTLDTEIKSLTAVELPVGLFAPYEIATQFKKKPLEDNFSKIEFPFALPSKLTSLRSETDQFLIKKKLNPICVFESNIISSVIHASSDGLGATFLPKAYVSRELKSEKLIQLNKRPLWNHRIFILCSRRGLDEGRGQFASKLINHMNLLLTN